MKTNSLLLVLGLVGPVVATAADQKPSDSAQVLTRAEAQKLVTEAKHYVAHPSGPKTAGKVSEPQVTTPDFDMPMPPPAPRAEAKPESPGANYVWVAGHYMPVKGEWRWVRGEWAVPATPISVWIVARYDEKERKWAPGYWQPDVAPATPSVPTQTAPGEPPVAPAPRY